MRIAVTGGAGFIGSHLTEAFLADGHTVAVVDNMSTGRRENLQKGAAFYELDIRDKVALDKAFGEFKPEVICHHAAQADVRVSVADPGMDADVNIVGSLRLVEAGLKVGCKRVLFASSGGAIYGEQVRHPADEEHPTMPVSPYGAAKLAFEHYLGVYAFTNGVRATCLRYANVYGPRQNPHGEAGVVAIFCRLLLENKECVINGDGGQTRDFVFVADVVGANRFALKNDLVGSYNVGTGVETNINQIYSGLAASLDKKVTAKHGPGKPGEQRRSSLTASKLMKLGWKPTMGLEEGLRVTAKWFDAARR